jgi:hypothetical protein
MFDQQACHQRVLTALINAVTLEWAWRWGGGRDRLVTSTLPEAP